jgi:hypothetical protein
MRRSIFSLTLVLASITASLLVSEMHYYQPVRALCSNSGNVFLVPEVGAQSVKLFHDFPVMSLDILPRQLIHPFFYLFAGHWSFAVFNCLARYVIGRRLGGVTARTPPEIEGQSR